LNLQLDELLIGSRQLGMAGSKILRSWSKQRIELHKTRMMMENLHGNLGAMREKHRALLNEHDECLKGKDHKPVRPSSGPSGNLPSRTEIDLSMEFMAIEENVIQVVRPSGKSKALKI